MIHGVRRLGLIVPLLVVAGCGSSASSSSPGSSGTTTTSTKTASGAGSTSTAGGGSAVTLSEAEFKITPRTDTVSSIGKITITVRNTGKIVHALAIQTPAGAVRTGNIAPGASATLTVGLAKGSYTFYCPIDGHRNLGMVGTLTVGAPAAGGGAATGGSTGAASSTTTTSTRSLGGARGY
jgi:uncharacterized cupredoxin-like copper-binding protein